MSENPRQFSSIDSSDANLHGSLTNRPPSGVPAGDPIDFEALNRQVINQRTQQDYVYKESTAEYVLRREREIAAAQRVRQETADAQAARAIQDQRNQQQRNEIANRTKSTPSDPEVAAPRKESPLTQQQRSTPERLPVPSTGSPPPTPKGTSARASALVEPTQTPAPAIPREALPIAATAGGIAATASALPRSLPQVASRLTIPGIGTGIQFAARVIVGQSVGQAAAGAIGGTIGGSIGFVAGSAIAGPIGGYVGSAIGGYVGGYIGDALFNLFLPSPATTPEANREKPYQWMTYRGSQYKVDFQWWSDTNPNSVNNATVFVWGEVGEIGKFPGDASNLALTCRGGAGQPVTDFQPIVIVNASAGSSLSGRITKITLDKVLFTPTSPDYNHTAPPPDNRSPASRYHPGNNEYATSPGMPGGLTASPKPNNYASGSGAVNATARGDSPNAIPHGYPAPKRSPHPEQLPTGLGMLLPLQSPGLQPLPFAEPDDIPTPRQFTVSDSSGQGVTSNASGFPVAIFPESPAFPIPAVRYDEQGNVLPTAIGGGEPSSFKPNPIESNPIRPNAMPTATPQTFKAEPVPDGVSPVPKANASPTPESPTETAARKQTEANDAIQKKIQSDIAGLTGIATAIAALTPAIQGIPDAIAKSPTVQASNKTTIQGAVCEIAQPTGCLGAPIKQAEDAANNNGTKLDQINAALAGLNTAGSAAQLALLDVINNKLGAQLPGGIAGKLTRFAKWAHLDRALNIMNLAASIHNGAMLSNNLAQTLLSVVGNLLSVVGLKDAEGQAFDIGSIINKSIEGLIKSAIGEENYKTLNTTWKRANRIYQATANLLNAVQSIGASILNALEVVGQWNAKVANALKRFAVVGERAYGWFNPNVNFQNKYFTALENVTNVVSQIDVVASEVLSIKESVGQIVEQKKEIGDSLKETDDSKQKAELPEAAKLAQKESESKVASAALPLAENDKEADED